MLKSAKRYGFGYVLDTNPHLAIFFVSGVIHLPTPRVWAHNSQRLWRTSTIRNSHASTTDPAPSGVAVTYGKIYARWCRRPHFRDLPAPHPSPFWCSVVRCCVAKAQQKAAPPCKLVRWIRISRQESQDSEGHRLRSQSRGRGRCGRSRREKKVCAL